MIWITGDLHGEIDISKLSARHFPEQKTMTRSDYVIICGDFGLVWDDSAADHYWLNWLENKPWTTLWIDGNHENYDLLEKFPTEDWHGGRVQRIREHILHLCRGSLFDLDGVRAFAFGGAESRDKIYRTPGITYWKQELPTAEEMERGRQVLEQAGWKADIVLSHTLPGRIQAARFPDHSYPDNALTVFFNEMESRLDFRYWFTGHYHLTEPFLGKYYMLYQYLIRYDPDGTLTWCSKWPGHPDE